MIDINFIPAQHRKKNAGDMLMGSSINIPREIVVGVGGVFLVALLCTHLVLGAMMIDNAARLRSWKAQWESLLPDKKNLDSIASELKDLKKKMNTIADITSKQSIAWSRNLNIISDNIPKGVWLRKILLDSTGFYIEGSAYSKTQNEIATIGSFVAGLKKDERFMKGLKSLEVNSIQRIKRKKTELNDFLVTAKLQ
jgi:Tfp pilus assembly protein PilN